MITWLDWYISGFRDKLPKRVAKTLHSDREAAWFGAMGMMSELWKTHQGRTDIFVKMSGEQQSMFAFQGMLLALCNPNPSRASEIAELMEFDRSNDVPATALTQVCGVQPTRELVQDLADAKPPKGCWDEVYQALRLGTWYVDIPDKAMLIGGGRQIRAIFTQPARDGVVALAVITKSGTTAMIGRSTWLIGPDCDVVERYAMAEGLKEVADRVTDFLVLLHLYRRLAAPSESEMLPHLDEKKLSETTVKKARAKHKTASLFRIVRLNPPPGRFGRSDGERSLDGWRLDHRIRVRGHFRMQPYGTGRSQRRLQWIAAHFKGPDDGEEKIDLLRVYSD